MKRILIVEDDPAVLRGLVRSFEDERYGVVTAMDGEEGFQLGKRENVDLIILDLMLPGKSGRDICHDLREFGVKTPILMLTAKKEEVDRVGGFVVGADDYVTKPFSVKELIVRVKALLRRREEYTEAAQEAAQLKRDVESVRQAQQSLVSQSLPAPSGWEFAGAIRPARTLAASYYDVFEISLGRVIVALCDVSGGGAAPPVVLAGIRSSLRSKAELFTHAPEDFLKELNEYLVTSSPPGVAVRLFIGALDLQMGLMIFANCGQRPPIFLRSKSSLFERFSEVGPVLNNSGTSEWNVVETVLETGDVLVVYNGGLAGAVGGHEEPFAESRLQNVVRNRQTDGARRILEAVVDSSEQFSPAANRTEDVAALVIHRSTRSSNP